MNSNRWHRALLPVSAHLLHQPHHPETRAHTHAHTQHTTHTPDGTVHFRQRERIFFTSLITQKPTGSTARLTVLREGAAVDFDIPLQPLQTLVPICK